MKQFKTIDEQVRILESRGMIVCDEAPTLLLRENYYAVINGYRDPFLDKDAMRSSGGDVYAPGTRFEWVYSLYRFDRELRHITFSYLIQAEAALKNATVYAFCESHRGCSDYLDRTSFCSPEDMLTPKAFRGNRAALHSNNMNRLMGILNGKLVAGPMTRPFVAHYLAAYGEVPLWVLVNDLTFGNMTHFFQLMKRGDQNSVCKHLFNTSLRERGDGRITPHEVLRAYSVLTRFRNLCAHDERLYCAEPGGDGYAAMLRLMEAALPRDVVACMRRDIGGLLRRYDGELHMITAQDLGERLGL